jgi:adenylate cyclase
MYHTFQQRLAHVLRAMLAWMFAYAIFGVVRLYGIGELPHVVAVETLDVQAFVLQLLLASVITGLLYGSVDIVLDQPEIQRLPYGVILGIRIALHVLTVLTVLVALIYSRVRIGIISEGYFEPDLSGYSTPGDSVLSAGRLGGIIFNKSFYVFALFFGVVSTILDFYQQVKQKFGRGVFLDMMLGRYHKPKESERIFIFIDLKSSVSLAEQLGHIRYSNLLQDCFFDLNTQLSRYDAKIYQYVGDQVVLHWKLKDGLRNTNCLNLFFGFLDRLEKRKSYYMTRYGLHPFFKAGAHTGQVTVAEVGLLKREIAFHGDTVNTTSRIHDFCNKYQQRILISKNLYDLVSQDPALQFLYIGDHVLKGKHHSMELYGVRRTTDAPLPGAGTQAIQHEEPSKSVAKTLTP